MTDKTEKVRKAIEQFRQMQNAIGGGCHDGYCVIQKPEGMHTNGGCGCLSHPDFATLQKVGHMLRAAQVMADHIESTLEQPQ